VCAQADKVNLILFSVVENLAIGLAFADRVFDVAPKMGVSWDSLLQPMSGLVVGSFPPHGYQAVFCFLNA